MWNRTFGCAGALEYSDELRRALLKLKPVTDIDVPEFPDQAIEEVSTIFHEGL